MTLPGVAGTLQWKSTGGPDIGTIVQIQAGQNIYIDQSVPNQWVVQEVFADAFGTVSATVQALPNQVFTPPVPSVVSVVTVYVDGSSTANPPLVAPPVPLPAISEVLKIQSDGSVEVH